MHSVSQNKIALSLAILALATVAVFVPSWIFLGSGILIFGILTFRWPLFGITATLLAAVAGEFGRIEIGGFSFLLLDIFALATFAIWLLRKFLLKEKIELGRSATSLLIFWAIALLSLLWGFREMTNAEFQFALLYFARFVGVSGLFLVVRDLPKKDGVKIFPILIFGGILFALAGFILFRILPDFTKAGLTELGWDPHIGRLTSTFLDPNFAAGAFAFLLAILGGRFLREKKFAQQVLLLSIAGIFLLALVLTFSRSGLLALGISGLVLGIWGDRRILVVGILAAFLGIAGSSRLAERVGELGQSLESLGGESQQVLDPTAQLRVDSWREGWRIFEENPLLGVGFGAYRFHQNFAAEDSHAATGSDASLLNFAAMTGILGLLAFGIFLVNLGADFWQTKNWGLLAALAGILLDSIFVNALLFAPLAAIFSLRPGCAKANDYLLFQIILTIKVAKAMKASAPMKKPILMRII
ncbi:MAG: O-antigen ligase family protein [Patescibacteria group bacterium]